jgi:hypothetical protein
MSHGASKLWLRPLYFTHRVSRVWNSQSPRCTLHHQQQHQLHDEGASRPPCMQVRSFSSNGSRGEAGFTKTLEAPVLVVGAGPVGIYMSLLLARHGIRSIVVDRGERGGDHGLGIRPHPRAHVLNTRTMELLREIGIDR